jgi:hypothetical protein
MMKIENINDAVPITPAELQKIIDQLTATE